MNYPHPPPPDSWPPRRQAPPPPPPDAWPPNAPVESATEELPRVGAPPHRWTAPATPHHEAPT
ncbi:MAG TPA: hypothetical protein VGF17_16470, partial [Phytomonospora sp.]